MMLIWRYEREPVKIFFILFSGRCEIPDRRTHVFCARSQFFRWVLQRGSQLSQLLIQFLLLQVRSGRLQWSPVHKSDKFWRENAPRFNEKPFDIVKWVEMKEEYWATQCSWKFNKVESSNFNAIPAIIYDNKNSMVKTLTLILNFKVLMNDPIKYWANEMCKTEFNFYFSKREDIKHN